MKITHASVRLYIELKLMKCEQNLLEGTQMISCTHFNHA